MRFRSEWVTVLTLTAVAAYLMTATRQPLPTGGARDAFAGAGVDTTPIGTTRNIDKRKHPPKP